jgi:hypothetical protein
LQILLSFGLCRFAVCTLHASFNFRMKGFGLIFALLLLCVCGSVSVDDDEEFEIRPAASQQAPASTPHPAEQQQAPPVLSAPQSQSIVSQFGVEVRKKKKQQSKKLR